MRKYKLQWGDGWETEIEAESVEEAREIAAEETRSGEWGDAGAMIDVDILSEDGDLIATVAVEIEPNHARLIADVACLDDICGTSPEDHDWTSEGEGGCDENPGVWSTGGTSLVFASHCTRCGLRRVEHKTGSQRNPGEHDRVEYSI